MTSGTRRPLAVLLILLVVLAGVLFLRRGDGIPAGSAGTPSNTAGGAAASADPMEPTDVKLELLHDDPDSLTEASRNPFRFEEKAPPPPPPRPPQAERPVFTPPPAPAGPPPLPPIPLRFIGFVAARDGARTATFSDGRGNVFHGREGDIIEGRYKVLRVGTDSVELAYLDGRGRQTIRLSGAQ